MLGSGSNVQQQQRFAVLWNGIVVLCLTPPILGKEELIARSGNKSGGVLVEIDRNAADPSSRWETAHVCLRSVVLYRALVGDKRPWISWPASTYIPWQKADFR